MAIYKIISTGDHILADQQFCEQVYPNDWEYVGEEQSDPAPRILTKLQAMERFTDAELAAIYTAAKSSVTVEVWLEKFKAAQEIDLDNASFVAGVRGLETAGLIGAGRAAEILA